MRESDMTLILSQLSMKLGREKKQMRKASSQLRQKFQTPAKISPKPTVDAQFESHLDTTTMISKQI